MADRDWGRGRDDWYRGSDRDRSQTDVRRERYETTGRPASRTGYEGDLRGGGWHERAQEPGRGGDQPQQAREWGRPDQGRQDPGRDRDRERDRDRDDVWQGRGYEGPRDQDLRGRSYDQGRDDDYHASGAHGRDEAYRGYGAYGSGRFGTGGGYGATGASEPQWGGRDNDWRGDYRGTPGYGQGPAYGGGGQPGQGGQGGAYNPQGYGYGQYGQGSGQGGYAAGGSQGQYGGQTGRYGVQGMPFGGGGGGGVSGQGHYAGGSATIPNPRVGRPPRNYQRSDDRIREDLCDTIVRSGDIDAGDVEVEVKGGEVTLSGTVDHREDKRRIEDIAEQIFGVRDVHNQIKVRGAGMSGVKDALSRAGEAISNLVTGATGRDQPQGRDQNGTTAKPNVTTTRTNV
jgi:hypothetical protein